MNLRQILLVAALAIVRPAFAGYDAFYVFGDSLSDVGNASLLSGGAFPGTPTGTFSNGPVAAQYMADYYGISGFGAFGLGGTDYAVGGATTGTANFNYEASFPAALPSTFANTGMSTQVAAFIGGTPVFDPTTTLFMVWGGPNDFFLGGATGQDPGVVASNAVTNLATMVGGLASTGARKILVPGLVDLGQTPLGLSLGSGTSQLLSELSRGFNDALNVAMGQVRQSTGADIVVFDTMNFFSQVLADPAAFGFTNTTGRCIDDPAAVASNCAGYLFVDEVHPTTAAHALLAAGFRSALPEPPVMTITVPLIGVAGWFAVRSRRRRTRG